LIEERGGAQGREPVMAKLIVIGNGFDLAHGIRSSYFAFRDHLQDRNAHLYETLTRLADQDVWWNLEEGLAHIDLKVFIENLLADYGLSESSSPYMNNGFDISAARLVQWTLDRIVRQLTQELKEELRAWILELDAQPASPVFDCIGWDDYIVSFNYTSTIERLYDVLGPRILYIHNRATKSLENFNFKWAIDQSPESMADFLNDEPQVIFGHGQSACDRSVPAIPVGSVTYDHDLNTAYSLLSGAFEEAYQYYDLSRKQVKDILPMLESFLRSVDLVDEVLILGHSLASVDLDYFRLIAQHAAHEVRYTITYYGPQNKDEAARKSRHFVRHLDEVEFVDMASPNRLVRQAGSGMDRDA
jgi:hypothetical protein